MIDRERESERSINRLTDKPNIEKMEAHRKGKEEQEKHKETKRSEGENKTVMYKDVISLNINLRL